MNKTAVVLLSGGLDSTVTLYYARSKGYEPKALTVDYNQLHKIEIKKAQTTTKLLGLDHCIIPIALPWKGSALLDTTIPIPKNRKAIANHEIPATYVPGRNTIFLSFALSWAEVADAQVIFIGANQLDYSGYPDCRGDFFQALQKSFTLGTKKGVEGAAIHIETPLLNMNKKEIILLGKELHVPFEQTWSCYQGAEKPCAACDACLLREKGFEEAGLIDPLM
ncbi:MAG: 7-cyano-7-deazaguanine synthase QueC [Candidatus Omnitrophica bacterium]|nr:7-cyano-7-deazaguanine synthase QueC [Candidatus Omnitrophota bacterium]